MIQRQIPIRPGSPLAEIFNVSPEEKERRNAGFLQLIDEWLADESGFDEQELPKLEQALDENRKVSGNYRKLFP
jgi:hypothetical protein